MKAPSWITHGVLVALVGCSSSSSVPDRGVLVVETEATGENIPEFSTLQIEGFPDEQILTDQGQSVTPPILVGPRRVELLVAVNCAVTPPNPRTVDVGSGPTITTFEITCS